MRREKAFVQFFKTGHRRNGDPVSDCIAGRKYEYLKLTGLCAGTQLSEVVRTFFLLDVAGITEDEGVRILGQAGKHLHAAAVQAAMEIQLVNVQVRKKEEEGKAFPPGKAAGRGQGFSYWCAHQSKGSAYPKEDDESSKSTPTKKPRTRTKHVVSKRKNMSSCRMATSSSRTWPSLVHPSLTTRNKVSMRSR